MTKEVFALLVSLAAAVFALGLRMADQSHAATGIR